MVELLKLLCDSENQLVKYRNGEQIIKVITEKEIRRNNIKSKWFINVMPNKSLLSPYISTKKSDRYFFSGKEYKYKLWGFKDEFLKAYNYVIDKKLFHEVLSADPINCPKCPVKHREDNYKLYVVYNPKFGNFCWGSLMSHLVLEHNYKPPRFFIEFIYYLYCQNVYGPDTNIIKLDENTLKYFEIMSRTGYEKKIGFINGKPDYNDDTYNIKYNGNIIAWCTDFDKKATTVKTRIKNIGILFGKAQIQDNNIVLYNKETNYDHPTINYIYYVHPYNYQKIKDPDYYDSFKIDIPQYSEYLSFIDLYIKQDYSNLLGLIIFVNEGVYVISKINDVLGILNNCFNKQAYQNIIRDTEYEYLMFVDDYKRNLNKEELTDEEKKHCYEQFRYKGSWVKKINDIIEPCHFKLTYFPKITIDKSKYNAIIKRYESIYDTLYLPINQCIN